VVTNDQLPNYQAEACRKNQRVRVDMNQRGAVRSERRIGSCLRQIDPTKLTTHLESKGYQRVKIVDRRRPPYIAQACKGPDRVQIEIGRYGKLREDGRIGSCATPIDPANLATILGKEGFDRVRVLRGHRLPHLVEACRNTSLMELTIGRFGDIDKEESVGRCVKPVTKKGLKVKFAKLGYLNVEIRRAGSGWTANMCRGEAKKTFRIDQFGDTVSERNSGTCTSSSVLDILKTLEKRGAKATTVFVEGCYRSKKYRWSYDRLGNRTHRKTLGKC